MATLWVRSQHDVAKEKIFGFLQKWNDKGRKYMFQILGRLVSFPGAVTTANMILKSLCWTTSSTITSPFIQVARERPSRGT